MSNILRLKISNESRVSKMWDVIWLGPRDSLVDVANHGLRWVVTLNVSWCLPWRSRLPLNSSWGLLRCSQCRLRRLLEQTPSSGRRGIGAVSWSRRRRLERAAGGVSSGSPHLASSYSSTKMLSPISWSPSHSKIGVDTVHGFVECDLIGLHNSVSFKVKDMICMRVRSIT